MTADNKKESSTNAWFISSLMWWRVDQKGQKDIEKQAANYDTTPLIKSFRGIAGLLLLLSAGVILIFILTGLVSSYSWFDFAIAISLVFFIFRGSKLAMILAMIFVTVEESFNLVTGFQAGASSTSNIGRLIVILLWWSFFMRFLYAAFRVERLRPPKPHLSEPTPSTASQGNASITAPSLNAKNIDLKVLAFILPTILVLGLSVYWFRVYIPHKEQLALEQRQQLRLDQNRDYCVKKVQAALTDEEASYRVSQDRGCFIEAGGEGNVSDPTYKSKFSQYNEAYYNDCLNNIYKEIQALRPKVTDQLVTECLSTFR